MGVQPEDLTDLIRTTLADLPKGQFEVMWDSQNFAFARIYNQTRRQIDGGTSIKRNVMLDRKGRARYRPLYHTAQPTVDAVQTQIDVPWAVFTTDYSWDVLEVLRNKGSSKGFINLIESRRTERLWDLAELFEERGWMTPDSRTDTLHPYGVPYYLNFLDNGSSVGGFHGKTIRFGDGSTDTVVAGIDGALEPKWRNYADAYTTIDVDLLKRLRQAIRRTRMNPPPRVPTPGNDAVGQMEVYASDAIVNELENLADSRDDNNTPKDLMGRVMHSFDGSVFINRLPLIYVPQLNNVTVADGGGSQFAPEPIYAVDWSKMQAIVQDGYWMIESAPKTDRGQPSTITVFVDGSHQNLCINRRTVGFVLHKEIPAA